MDTNKDTPKPLRRDADPPELEVVIEIPRGSFLKRGSSGRIDFVSPLPCPFNYGSAPAWLGLEGDLLDIVVLGPRLPRGSRLRVKAWGAVTLRDRGMVDDKLVCSAREPSAGQRRAVLAFFHLYARCKSLVNRWRGRSGRNACEGWRSAEDALARARPRDEKLERADSALLKSPVAAPRRVNASTARTGLEPACPLRLPLLGGHGSRPVRVAEWSELTMPALAGRLDCAP